MYLEEAFFFASRGVAGPGYDQGGGGGVCGKSGDVPKDRPAQPYQEPGEVIGWGWKQSVADWLVCFVFVLFRLLSTSRRGWTTVYDSV